MSNLGAAKYPHFPTTRETGTLVLVRIPRNDYNDHNDLSHQREVPWAHQTGP